MPNQPRLRRPVAVLALVSVLGACTTWTSRPVPAPSGQEHIAGTVRVTRAAGRPMLLDSVTIGADSIVGRALRNPDARVAIPVSDVRRVEGRRADPFATAALVVGTAIAALVLYASWYLGRYGLD